MKETVVVNENKRKFSFESDAKHICSGTSPANAFQLLF